ncbi:MULTISPECIES: hypothetical protein [Nocardia]|uniref:Xaa-Pro dipeptidase n=1 Tax=Nocardia aurea TaxID=2144174 RepID=A0ABV3G3K2_9NOCA|nr:MULTISPECIES: hypothetical protein [Nocardia]
MTTSTTEAATVTKQLPEEFAALSRFSAWILPTEPERYTKRLASSMEEMQDLYDVGMEHLDAALDYCDKFDINDLPDEARNLFHLLQSVVMVSFPIECWSQARVPDSGAAYVALVHEPVV